MKDIIICLVCKKKKVYAKGLCQKCYMKQYQKNNKEKINKYNMQYYKNNKEKINKISNQYYIDNRDNSMSENKDCALYLGIHVAEQVLFNVFKNVKQMPNGNEGFDFICNKGMKIDVKSGTIHIYDTSLEHWLFRINKNEIADYFLCLAFDNREDLNPLHIWLIPAKYINHLVSLTISKSTIHKWDKYKLDVNKVIDCCSKMKGD